MRMNWIAFDSLLEHFQFSFAALMDPSLFPSVFLVHLVHPLAHFGSPSGSVVAPSPSPVGGQGSFDTPHGATAVYSPAAMGGSTRSWWPHGFLSQGSCQADSSHSWYIVTQGVCVAQAVLCRSALDAFGVQGSGLCPHKAATFCLYFPVGGQGSFDTPHGATAVYSPAAMGGSTRSWWPHGFLSQGSCQADSSHSWYIVTQGVCVAQAVLCRSALDAFGVQGSGL